MKNPVEFTTHEGGMWLPWAGRGCLNKAPTGAVVHSVRFEDGSVFDAVNGWRGPPLSGDDIAVRLRAALNRRTYAGMTAVVYGQAATDAFFEVAAEILAEFSKQKTA
jgi:hypothetical protein